MTSISGITIVLLTFLLYRYVIHPAFVSPLSKIPNAHFTVPFLPLWMWWKRQKGTENNTIYSLHKRHGPVVRVGPNELSVNSIDGLRTIYIGGFEKTDWYRGIFLNYGTDNLVSMVDYKTHSVQKRMITNVYSKSYLQNSPDLKMISTTIVFDRLLPLLDKLARTRKEVNVLSFGQAIGMDFTSAYLFGLANGSDFIRDAKSWELWLEKYETFKNQHPKERAWGEIEKWCFDRCKKAQDSEDSGAEKLSPDGNVNTMPVVYRQLRRSLGKSSRSPQKNQLIVASEMLDHLIAGHETSGITLTYFMWRMSQRPDLQKRLREELLNLSPQLFCPIAPRNGEKQGNVRIPSSKAIDSLPLLDATLRETLRLHPAAPGPQPRVTPFSHTPTSINGYANIPGGVKVSSSAYTLHRNLEVYPNPTEWLPERWLEPEPGKIENMRRLFWAFGSGGRMCIGNNFALQKIKLVLAAIYTNFMTIIINDEGIEQEDSYIAPPVGRKLIVEFRRL
ncbi:Cytochrome P450 [Elaphomyces granulatus]